MVFFVLARFVLVKYSRAFVERPSQGTSSLASRLTTVSLDIKLVKYSNNQSKVPLIMYISCHTHCLLLYFLQRWYIDGTVECFTGGHAILASFAILVLIVCIVLIATVMAIVMGKPEVAISVAT